MAAIIGIMTSVGESDVAHAVANGRLYTLNADFDEGTALNLNHNAPGINQLQLNTSTTPFPFVNIPASGRGTVIRIDVNTGAVLSEYRTSPDGMAHDPSRTTVDQHGNVWVANRAEASISGGVPKGSIARIGLVIGGTRADSDGTVNPSGQYLKPPFQYSTCLDRNFDNLIKTSSGLGNILPWTNAAGADTDGGVTTADDECVINYTRVFGTGTRTLAIAANNDVWVGGMFGSGPPYEHERVDGTTGQPIAGTHFNLGCGGYGGLIDANGILWSAGRSSALLRYDTNTNTGACLTGRGDYGLGIDPTTGNVWHSSYDTGTTLYEISPSGAVLHSYPQGFQAQGVAVDGQSHVWVAEVFGSKVAHFAPDPANTGQHVFVGNVTGFLGSTGVSVDANGKIWVAERNGNSASRINPAAGPIGGGGYPVGAIDLTVSLGSGASPYNYSDMTGFVAIGSTAPQGTWTVVYDSEQSATEWGKVSWNTENSSPCPSTPQGREPAGASITSRVRSAETPAALAAEAYVGTSNGVDVSIPNGRYLQVEMKLTPNGAGTSPVLCDMTVDTVAAPPPPPPPSGVVGGFSGFVDGSETGPLSLEAEGPQPHRWQLIAGFIIAGGTLLGAYACARHLNARHSLKL